MPQHQSVLDTEKLREFELRMHYEGTAAFAAGPSPWESWDDAGTLGTWQRLEDQPQHPVRQPHRRSVGQRLLGGLTRLLMLTLLVGIGGVYLSTATREPLQVSGIRPAPIVVARTTATAMQPAATLVSELEALPAPAAGNSPRPAIAAAVTPAMPAAEPDTRLPKQATTTSGQEESTTELATLPAVTAPSWPAQNPFAGTTLSDQEQELQEVAAPAADSTATQSLDTLPAAAAPSWPEQEPLASAPIAAQQELPPETATPVAADPVPDDPEAVPALQTAKLEGPALTATGAAKASPALEAASAPAPHSKPEGQWVVNLASYTRESTAQRMLEVFRDKGVEAEIISITVNDKPMVRIRTTGYRSASEARDWVALLEERLDLDGVWISKR
jgi:hypothetical protein